MDKVATLFEAHRGFGGDNYSYRLTPPHEGNAVAHISIGWGLLSPMTVLTNFSTCGKEVQSPEEALQMIGYQTVGEVDWTKTRINDAHCTQCGKWLDPAMSCCPHCLASTLPASD